MNGICMNKYGWKCEDFMRPYLDLVWILIRYEHVLKVNVNIWMAHLYQMTAYFPGKFLIC